MWWGGAEPTRRAWSFHAAGFVQFKISQQRPHGDAEGATAGFEAPSLAAVPRLAALHPQPASRAIIDLSKEEFFLLPYLLPRVNS